MHWKELMLIPNVQEKIYYYYHSSCAIGGKKFFSPFRKDNHPSFTIKNIGKWLTWNDWGTGESGNCFDFVAKLYNLNTKKDFSIILQKICIDLGLEYLLNNNSETIKQLLALNKSMSNNISDVYKHVNNEDDKIKLKFKRKPFNQDELYYWKSQGMLDEKSLKYLDIYSVSEAYMVVGNYVKTVYNYSAYKNINTDNKIKKLFYCFAYNYDNKYLKLYRPFYYDKWKSTVPGNMVCTKTIFDNDTLIITKAKKEQLHLLDIQKYMIDKFDILPLNNEQKFIDWYYYQIKDKYKRIILWLDNDRAGHTSMNKWKELYNLEIYNTNSFKNITDLYNFEYQLNKSNALKQSLCILRNLLTK